jgi:O-6-methylguanine DNA methyltransferase
MRVATKVYELASRIPKGKVATYGELAKAAGTSPRHVGYLMSINNSKKVPCHRVVGSDGSLVGFAHGLGKKKALLLSEGVPVGKGKVDLKKYFYRVIS